MKDFTLPSWLDQTFFFIRDVWDKPLWKENAVSDVVIAVGVFFLILIAVRIFRTVFLRRLKRMAEGTKTKLDDTILEKVGNISKLFYVVFAFFLTAKFLLQLGPQTAKIVDGVFFVLLAYEVLRVAQAMIFYSLRRSALGKNKTSLQGIKLVANILLWAIGILLVLSNLGFDVSTLVASLGIGGIAIALAAQNILGDLFSSFTIYFDKPFEVGDFIVLGQDMGTVQKIGLKTTRILTLRGEELVVPNRELTGIRVQNFQRLQKRRVPFQIGVTYDTPSEKLEKIPELIRTIIQNTELAEFDRTHFKGFGDFSLNFEIVYYVLAAEYNIYMDTQQKINLAIVKAFEKEKIEFAFPTQTLHVQKD
ncbi:MAG: mechanosensitive ion channel family protein [Candidatus Gracilibacteria bacterium]|nr:mechanosensitive ion channel family protein [Candidatus Gracilibacteria bacterium]